MENEGRKSLQMRLVPVIRVRSNLCRYSAGLQPAIRATERLTSCVRLLLRSVNQPLSNTIKATARNEYNLDEVSWNQRLPFFQPAITKDSLIIPLQAAPSPLPRPTSSGRQAPYQIVPSPTSWIGPDIPPIRIPPGTAIPSPNGTTTPWERSAQPAGTAVIVRRPLITPGNKSRNSGGRPSRP